MQTVVKSRLHIICGCVTWARHSVAAIVLTQNTVVIAGYRTKTTIAMPGLGTRFWLVCHPHQWLLKVHRLTYTSSATKKLPLTERSFVNAHCPWYNNETPEMYHLRSFSSATLLKDNFSCQRTTQIATWLLRELICRFCRFYTNDFEMIKITFYIMVKPRHFVAPSNNGTWGLSNNFDLRNALRLTCCSLSMLHKFLRQTGRFPGLWYRRRLGWRHTRCETRHGFPHHDHDMVMQTMSIMLVAQEVQGCL